MTPHGKTGNLPVWLRRGRGEGSMARRVDEDERDEARRTAALMGFIVILLLAIAGVMLARALRDNARLEDCLMQGRSNCMPIELPLPPA